MERQESVGVKSLRKIGAGGYGSIYNNDSQSVLKLVSKKEESSSQVKSILNEIAIYKYLLRFKTEHILKPYQYIDNENVLGIILQRGHISLNEYLKRHRQGIAEIINGTQNLFFTQLLCIFKKILIAIEALDKSGVIHCDIKPQNIMIIFGLQGEFSIFLIDFGLSQLSDQNLYRIKNSSQLQILQNPSKTAIKGTDTLVDPQIVWNNQITNYCDLWSLGISLLQIFIIQDFKFLEIKCLQKMKQLNNKELILDTIIQKQLETINNIHIKYIIKQLLQTKFQSRQSHQHLNTSLQRYIDQVIQNEQQIINPNIPFIQTIYEKIPIIRRIDTLLIQQQKIYIYNISDNIIIQAKQQENSIFKPNDVVIVTLQGEVFFNNSVLFGQVFDKLKSICTSCQFPQKLKQKTVSYWNILSKRQVQEGKQSILILKLQYMQAPDHKPGETLLISFNTTTKMHIMIDQQLYYLMLQKYVQQTKSQIIAGIKKEPIPIIIYQDLKISSELTNQSLNQDLLEQFAILVKLSKI